MSFNVSKLFKRQETYTGTIYLGSVMAIRTYVSIYFVKSFYIDMIDIRLLFFFSFDALSRYDEIRKN